MRHYLYICIIISCNCFAQSDEVNLCSTDVKIDASTVERPSDNSINISADELVSTGKKSIVASGNVVLTRKNDSLQADKLVVTNAQINADGEVIYQQSDSTISADSISLDQKSDKANFTNATLHSSTNNSTIQAEKIQQIDANKKNLSKVKFTTCKPDNVQWHMSAEQLELNQESGRGIARNIQLRLFDVPFFYAPIFSFPIDNRRSSGFLYPSFGNSSDRGTEVSIPFYWNIAPQADSTITPRYFSKHGLLLNTEWRYLNKNTENLFHSENLDDDLSGQNRWFYHYKQNGEFGNNWTSQIYLYNLSDPGYLDDLDSEFETTSNFLKRFIEIENNSQYGQFRILAQDYEAADEGANDSEASFSLEPYISYANSKALKGVTSTFSSEHVSFDHETRTDTGSRWHNSLSFEKKFGQLGWFIKPKLSTYYTEYSLDNDTSLDRKLSTISIDSGLILDRFTPQYQQTLEPRLFLLHVPFEDQSALPNFDTSLASNNYNLLFSENRFNGNDRFGDTSQASLGLTSRIYNQKNNKEVLRFQVAQSYYFEDRLTTVSDNATDESDISAVISDIKWQLSDNWNLRSNIEWPNSENDTRDSRFSLQYARDNHHLLYLSHSYERDESEQVDINGRWRLKKNWTLLGKYQFDIENEQNIHRFAGLEYENCCLALRVVSQNILEDTEQKNEIYLQLSLKGLSTAGRLDSKIAQGINGFNDFFD